MPVIDVTPPQLLLPLVEEEPLHPGELLGTTRHLAPVADGIQLGPLDSGILTISSIKGNSESGSPSFCVESLGLGFSN